MPSTQIETHGVELSLHDGCAMVRVKGISEAQFVAIAAELVPKAGGPSEAMLWWSALVRAAVARTGALVDTSCLRQLGSLLTRQASAARSTLTSASRFVANSTCKRAAVWRTERSRSCAMR